MKKQVVHLKKYILKSSIKTNNFAVGDNQMDKNDTDKKHRHPGWLLIKNRLSAQTGINVFRYGKDRHKKRVKIAITIVIAVCLLVMMIYCGAAAYGYAYLGLGELIPGIAMVISSLITLFFTIFKANGDLFAFRDYDTLMSLPIPVRTVIYSRLGNMYFWNTFIAFLVMMPMAAIYSIYVETSMPVLFFWLAGILLTCLIPTIIAAFFGALITAIASKFRYANVVSSILGIGFVVALMVLSMTFTTGDSGLGEFVNPTTGVVDVAAISTLVPILSDMIYQIYPPAMWFADAIIGGSVWSFFLLFFTSILLYGLFARLLAMKYRQINSALTSRVNRADYKLEVLQQGSMRSALYKKTILRILKSPVCATNLLIGCVMAILLAVAMVAVGPEKVMSGLDASAYMHLIQNGAGFALAAIVSMTNTSAVSLALEGKNIWLIKSLPIPSKTLYDSYLLTNLSFTLPTSVICATLFSIALKTGLTGTFILFMLPISFSLFSAVMGIFIGNRMAYYDWQEETQLVKQSLMSITGMLGGMVVVLICGAVAVLELVPIDSRMISLTFIALYLTGAAVIYLRESVRPIKD
jgi:ABC-2 type transport system permease protein